MLVNTPAVNLRKSAGNGFVQMLVGRTGYRWVPGNLTFLGMRSPAELPAALKNLSSSTSTIFRGHIHGSK